MKGKDCPYITRDCSNCKGKAESPQQHILAPYCSYFLDPCYFLCLCCLHHFLIPALNCLKFDCALLLTMHSFD